MEHIQSFLFETVRFAKILNIHFCMHFLFVFVREPQGRIALELIGLPSQKCINKQEGPEALNRSPEYTGQKSNI